MDVLKITQKDQEDLQHLSDLLHLFHHRNKNQHRRSIWYRHFSTFRKQLALLTEAIETLNQIPTTNLARTRKKLTDPGLISTAQKRIAFWQDVMVARWQHAFSQLIADGRFAVLGLVLTAALAQVCQIVGITAKLEEIGQEEVEKVLEEFGREEWGGLDADAKSGEREDLGEVVRRDDEPLATDTHREEHQVLETVSISTMKKTKRPPQGPDKVMKKKRKKGGNAIDDIFG